MLTNKYDAPLNGASMTSLTVNIFVQCFSALIYIFLLWLMPFSVYVLLIYFAFVQVLTRFFYARALSRRRRCGPDLALPNEAVSLFPFTAPIKLIAADLIMLAALLPVSLVACLVTHSRILPTAFPEFFSNLSAVTNVMDAFTTVIGLVGTVSAFLLRRSAAYRTNTIHRAPILTLSPTHLEFHPLLETSPVRIPWDRKPFLVNIDYPVVKRDTTKRAHITTTESQTPTMIDITCLDLTREQLQRIIGCFACRPQYRDTLATEGGIELVRGLASDNPALWPA